MEMTLNLKIGSRDRSEVIQSESALSENRRFRWGVTFNLSLPKKLMGRLG